MNQNGNHNKAYKATDIERYVQGLMSAAEMHAMERASLEDPFLADAIDGYDEMKKKSGKEVETGRTALKMQLSNRITGAQQLTAANSTRWWRIAALLLVLAGAGSIVYTIVNTQNLQKTDVISENKITVPRRDTSTVQSYNVLDTDSTALVINEKPGKVIPQTSAKTTMERLLKAKHAASPVEPQPSLATSRAPLPSFDSSAEKNEDVAAMVPAKKRLEEAVDNISMSRKISPPDTNASGYFKQEEKSAKEQDAMPSIGYIEYNRYIERSKRIDTFSKFHGEVVISFFVNTDGSLDDFKIAKSLSKSIDEEAIRLIKEGPTWKVLQKKKARVLFTIWF